MTDRAAPRRLPVVASPWPRVPAHVVVMLSATTAGYAISLAGVTAIQAGHEAEVAAARAPAVAGVSELTAGHDALAEQVERARKAYAGAADAYTRATETLAGVDAALAGLASAVAEIDGVSRSLPTSIHVPVQRVVTQVKAPTTHATTGASGG